MVGGHVLVAYGSRNGGTAEIAEWIADELRTHGLSVDCSSARAVTSVAGYDAVVVGGAIYLRRWHKDARSFVRRYSAELSELPVWLFSSGPVDPDTVVPSPDAVPWVRRAGARVHARTHITFGGRLTSDSPDWFARRLAARSGTEDYRDPVAVRSFARGIAADLLSASSE